MNKKENNYELNHAFDWAEKNEEIDLFHVEDNKQVFSVVLALDTKEYIVYHGEKEAFRTLEKEEVIEKLSSLIDSDSSEYFIDNQL